jgi:hypothetical protein
MMITIAPTYFFCRKIEEEVIKSAALVGKVRTTTLIAKIRERILRSPHPQAVIHMRKIDALRQVVFYFPCPPPPPSNPHKKALVATELYWFFFVITLWFQATSLL